MRPRVSLSERASDWQTLVKLLSLVSIKFKSIRLKLIVSVVGALACCVFSRLTLVELVEVEVEVDVVGGDVEWQR